MLGKRWQGLKTLRSFPSPPSSLQCSAPMTGPKFPGLPLLYCFFAQFAFTYLRTLTDEWQAVCNNCRVEAGELTEFVSLHSATD